MSNPTDISNVPSLTSTYNGLSGPTMGQNIFLPQALSQQVNLNNLKGSNNISLPVQVSSPDLIPSQVKSPMISLSDNIHQNFIGKRVSPIDPKIASDKLKELATNGSVGLLSPSYAKTPSRAPPLGSILQTPPDTTPTHVSGAYINDLSQGYLAPARSPMISKSINDFIQNLPSVTNYIPPSTSPRKSPRSFEIKEPIPIKDEPKYIHNSNHNINHATNYVPNPVPNINPVSNPIPNPVPNSNPDMTKRIKDAKTRADYRVKFSILREAYPQMEIPEPNDNEPVELIEAQYKEYVKRIHVDSSVEQNKIYLLILWLIIEVVGTRVLKLPFGGYVKSQFKYMTKYQMLLVELGERSYVESGGEGWPVEFRLLAMAVFHGVIFILVQLLASKLGGGGAHSEQQADKLREIIDNFLTQNKGEGVLRRAEQATADNPPPSSTQNASPPLGDLGGMLANFLPMITGFFGGGGQSQPTEQPQVKRPTTFGARNRKNKTENDSSTNQI